MNCYRCGDPGHFKAQCPFPAEIDSPPAPYAAAPAPDRPEVFRAPPASPCQQSRRKVISWGNAALVRRAMGWQPDQRAARLRELAAAQAAESRAGRGSGMSPYDTL